MEMFQRQTDELAALRSIFPEIDVLDDTRATLFETGASEEALLEAPCISFELIPDAWRHSDDSLGISVTLPDEYPSVRDRFLSHRRHPMFL